MSKGQKRNNREQKKPKQAKPKVIAAATSLLAQAKPDSSDRGKKRW